MKEEAVSEPCYNKFLSYYNLPIFTSTHTLSSFLRFLKQIKFLPNFTISVNKQLTEIHIYLPYEQTLLPHLQLVEQFNYNKYSSLSLKFFNNRKLSKPNFEEYLTTNTNPCIQTQNIPSVPLFLSENHHENQPSTNMIYTY